MWISPQRHRDKARSIFAPFRIGRATLDTTIRTHANARRWSSTVCTGLSLAVAFGISQAATQMVGTIPGTVSISLGGSSSYSIPIRVAPGSGATQPVFQLVYDSQSLGGSLGAGWSLGGLSAISRGPHEQMIDGRPRAVSLDEQDAIYLDGQRLLPAGPSRGTGQTQELDYRKANDDFTQVTRFGPDLEHSFFRARTKSGLTVFYGNPALSGSYSAFQSADASIRFSNGSLMALAESIAVDAAGESGQLV